MQVFSTQLVISAKNMTVTISQLISYPIKSCAGIQHQQATIDSMGLVGDRQLMLVDANGLFLSQRKHPQMALIESVYTKHDLMVNAPGMEPLSIDLQQPIDDSIQVKVWKDSLLAEPLQPSVNQWFSDYLNIPVRLVKYGKQSHRLIDHDFAKNAETVAFADGYPLLIAHDASLGQLNQHLEKPIGMDRFRPNIVVNSELSPWDELTWNSLSDEFKIDLVKPCTRCVMTGVEQTTGEQTGSEALKTLKQKFAHQEKAVFGINAIARTHDPIELCVGQKLKVY